MNAQHKPRFALGQVVATPGALAAMEEAGQNLLGLLTRHQSGDWGELCDEDKAENELSVREGFRILSAYVLTTNVKVWIITESNRSATTLLNRERLWPPCQSRFFCAENRATTSVIDAQGHTASGKSAVSSIINGHATPNRGE